MLVLSRKDNQRIWIGNSIILTVVKIQGEAYAWGSRHPRLSRCFATNFGSRTEPRRTLLQRRRRSLEPAAMNCPAQRFIPEDDDADRVP